MEIRKKYYGTYEVSVTSLGVMKCFLFEVEDGEIQVVKWSDEFAKYMDNNLGPAEPILEAILTFHQAQNVSLKG